MDLKSGQAAVLPGKERSFDPTKIARAVRGAGFTPGEIEVTAAGMLAVENDLLRLEMPGSLPQVILAGGAKAEELGKQRDLIGHQVRVTGILHPSHGDKPPGITVEHWMLPNAGSR